MEPLVRADTRVWVVLRAWRELFRATACGALCLAALTLAASAQPTARQPATPSEPPEEEVIPIDPNDARYDPPKLTAEGRKDWEHNHRLKFGLTLKKDRIGAAEKEELTQGVQYHLYRLTMREERYTLHDIVRKLLDDLKSPVVAKEARDFVHAEIVRVAGELMGQPPRVRYTVLILAASLVTDPNKESLPPYRPATGLFLQVLTDPSQPVACKLVVTNGLARICRDVESTVADRSRIVTDLVTALSSQEAKDPHNFWYRKRLVDALGDAQLVYDATRQPIVIDALLGILSDAQENWIVRSSAARAITQLPWEANVNVPLICYQVCRMGEQMGAVYNRTPKEGHWRYCFTNLYMAFVPQTAEQKQKKWGLLQQVTRPGLGQHQPLAESAYSAVMPMINSVLQTINSTPVPKPQLEAVKAWEQQNAPQDWKATPSSREIKRTQPEVPPMASSDGAASAARNPASPVSRASGESFSVPAGSSP